MSRLADLLVETRNGLYKPEHYYGSGIRILKMFNIGRLDGTWNLERVDLIEHTYRAAWMNSASARRQVGERLKQIVGQATLNRGDLESLTIPLPSLAEQRRATTQLRQQLAAAARMRTAAENQAESIFRTASAFLATAFDSAEVVASQRVSLGEVCVIEAPQVDPKLPEFGQLPHVNGENIESGTGRLLEVRSAAEDGMASGKYLFKPGDVLYSKLRPYLRKAALVDFRGLCSADMYPMRALEDRLDSRFLKWLLLSAEFTAYADEESRRARMPKLNREQLLSWLAPLPSVADQRRIAEGLQRRLDATWAIRATINEQTAEIGRLSAALLCRAFGAAS